MSEKPVLSIVTPTRGNFSEYWLAQLLEVKGSVEFVLVYPPDGVPQPIDDPRALRLRSPYRGEMMQRLIGLLNASGTYVLALDDDDFVHPDVVGLTLQYFQRFPQSWVLRLKKAVIDFRETDRIRSDWAAIPDVDRLEVLRKTLNTPNPYRQGAYAGLLEVPIAPLSKSFDWRRIVLPFIPRKDNDGYHFENFNNIVWRNEIVQQALPDLAQTTRCLGVLTWIPNSGGDRLFGLFVQAKHFRAGAIIGHWMPPGEQVRYVDKPPALKPARFHILSDVLLIKRFPQYGYLWNLCIDKLYAVPRTIAKLLRMQMRPSTAQANASARISRSEVSRRKSE